MAKFETVRGMRDFLPEEELFRQRLFDQIKKVLERHGFLPWEAPALEYEKLLKEKTVEEKLIYKFKDRGGRAVVLRPEKTPSLARIIASNPNLPKPLKLYNIGRVWRYDRPQKGRYREFWQIDIDIIGSSNPLADAELLACTNAILRSIGLKKFTFRISSRKLANQLLIDAGVSQKLLIPALRAIDKLDKIGEDGVGAELRKKGVSKESVAELLSFIRIKGSLKKIFSSFLIDGELKKELLEFEKRLKDYGIKNYIWDLSLVRGLDYYTGLVFEVDAGKGIGSIAGGGRYDKLIGIYTGKDVPATGLALGFERIVDILRAEKAKTSTQIYIIPIKTEKAAIKIAQQLRYSGINTDMDLTGRSISKNLSYANKLGIPYVAIIGQQELAKKKIKLRNMRTGKEQLLTIKQVIKKLS